MGAETKIQWADSTVSFWIGCEKVSAACDSCYAQTWANRFMAGKGLWEGNRHRTSKSTWSQPLKWNAAAKKEGVRRRVFVNSLSDFFDNQVDPEWRRDAFNVMAQCLWLDFLLLTKRPQNIAKLAPQMADGREQPWAPNIWLGTTIENREEMHRRARLLKAIPATVHFWSAEPLLEDLGDIPPSFMPSWIICGGESGKNAREMPSDWARALRDQCKAAGVAFFMKQMTKMAAIPEDLFVRQFPERVLA